MRYINLRTLILVFLSKLKSNGSIYDNFNLNKTCPKSEYLEIDSQVLELSKNLLTEYEIIEANKLLSKAKFVGEIGLDYQVLDNDLKKKQKEVFEKILHMSATYKDKILTIHSRRSSEDVVSMIGSNFPGTIILHWFSGSSATLKRSIKNGYYFSINPSMIGSKNGQTLVNQIPLEKVLIESDGPFINIGKRKISPSDVELVVSYLAKIHKKTKEQVQIIIKNNFLELLNR